MSKAIKNLEVLIDWSKIVSAHAAYTEILNQIKAPKSHGHDIDSLQASLVLGKLKKTKPPYSFVNLNVSLAPDAVHDVMLWVFRVFNQSAMANPGTEVIIKSGNSDGIEEITANPADIDRKKFVRLIANGEWPVIPRGSRRPPAGPARDQYYERLSRSHKEAVREFFETTTSSEELHIFAKSYNWDQGFSYPMKIIENPTCDLNTALLVFWLAGVDYYQRGYKKRPAKHSRDREGWDLIQAIMKNVVAGKYTKSQMPDDFRKEIIEVPAEQQKWEIHPLLYGSSNQTPTRKKRTKKPGKKKASKKKVNKKKKQTSKRKK